jgi:hypothetical protein
VNLVGHVAVTLSDGPAPSPDFLVGCMLPDVAAIARVRVTRPDGEMGRGVEYHHDCDAVFHDSPWFLEHNVRLRDDLLRAGVERGAARACAHAGLEMLLDGAFVDDARVQLHMRGALATLDDRAESLAALAAEPDRERWVDAVHRIARALDTSGYADPESITLRLQRMTAGRRRIELRADHTAVVTTVLATAQPNVLSAAPAVLTEVRRGTGTHRAAPRVGG